MWIERWRLSQQPDHSELAVLDHAIPLRIQPTVVKDNDALLAQLRGFMERARERLLAFGQKAYGEIELELPKAGIEIELDGQVITQNKSRSVRLTHTPKGLRRLSLRGEGLRTFSRSVSVKPGALVRLQPDLTPAGESALVRWTKWSGVAVAALGVAALVVGGAQVAVFESTPGRYCIEAWRGTCSSRFLRINDWRRPPPGPVQQSYGGGLALIPLGYSLAGAGLISALSAWLTNDSDHLWIAIASAVAAGGLSYGLSVSL